MMSYIENMRNRRRSKAATEHLLRMCIVPSKYSCVIVVEGEDDESYYRYSFREVFQDKSVRVIVCDGKGGVLGIRDFFDQEYSDSKHVLFFIDRDHDDFLKLNFEREDTFVTDWYSVEWFLCDVEVLSQVFGWNYRIEIGDPIVDEFNRYFDQNLSKILRRLRIVMSVVLLFRLRDVDVNIDRIHFNSLFSFERSGCTLKRLGVSALEKSLGVKFDFGWREIIAFMRGNSLIDYRKLIRGRLGAEMCCEYIAKAAKITSGKRDNGRELRQTVSVTKVNYVKLAVEYSMMPSSLRQFLQGAAPRLGQVP